jgi:diguanylate cyclase (GGDEF)-like protein
MGVIGIWIFATKLTDAFERLETQANLDGLTQIHNRVYFDDYFQREYLRSRRYKSPLSILLCDVDFFKLYNDTYGHQMGDNVLIKIAAVLQSTIKRPGDMVARFGGEEFVIVLPDTSHEGAYAIAELLRANVEQLRMPHKNNQISSFVTISIGVWTYHGEDVRIETVFDTVDAALYKAKEAGRNMVYSSEKPE